MRPTQGSTARVVPTQDPATVADASGNAEDSLRTPATRSPSAVGAEHTNVVLAEVETTARKYRRGGERRPLRRRGARLRGRARRRDPVPQRVEDSNVEVARRGGAVHPDG